MKNITRRSFIASTVAVGMAHSAASQALATSAAPSDSPVWDAEADLVVIGYGCAGIGAIKAATDLGATVIVLEKAPEELAGGSLAANDGNWSYVTPESLVNGSFGRMSSELAQEINDDGHLYSDWLADCGLEWMEKTNSVGQTVLAAPYGLAIWRAANSYFEGRDDVTILYETPAVALVQNSQGEVVGVTAERDGKRVNYRAAHGVVIASGTYASNPDFVQGHHYACLPYASGTSPYNTGDGMVLAARIGAKAFQDLSLAIEFGPLAVRKASEELGTAIPMSSLYYSGVMVNGEGRRFMSEDREMGHNKSTEPILTIKCTNSNGKKGNYGNGYYNLPAWVVFDAETYGSDRLMRPFGWATVRGVYAWSDDNQAEVAKGWVLKGDTLEELASQMTSKNDMTGEDVSVDAATLAKTIMEYNAGAEAGEDKFGKSVDYLKPLGDGPYYAVEIFPSVMYSNNGISVNDDTQVLDWDNEPIPGLYAVGDIASRERATRICMTGDMVTGGHAAKHALA